MNPVLMYHYLGSLPPPGTPHRGLTVPPEEFEEQLAILSEKEFNSVTSHEYDLILNKSENKQRSVWLTFDDGQIDNYEIAFPLLKSMKMKATFFCVSDWALEGKSGYINQTGLREMLAEGMEIGSHSCTHPHLARLTASQIQTEIADSKKKLEDMLQTEIQSFCYPYGNWNDQVIGAVQKAGYRLALSTIRDNCNGREDRWRLHRAMVQPGRTGLRFRYLLSPLYHWVHDRKNRKRWKD